MTTHATALPMPDALTPIDPNDRLWQAVLAKFDGQPGGVIRMSAAVEGERLVLAVYDNGVGMSAQQVEYIRRQVVVSGKIEGHGLGLQFVWRECVGNGFALAVESGEGEFSRFTIWQKRI